MDRKDKIKKRLQKKVQQDKKELKMEEKKGKMEGKKEVKSFDNLKKFEAISEFVGDMTSIYGENLLELEAYNKLLSATTIKNKTAIEYHVKIITEYCKNNEKTIIDKNEKEIKNINYSDMIFIDMVSIFKIAEESNKVIIWNHLLTILYMTNPSSELKNILQNMNSDKKEDNEGKFLSNIIDKLQNNVSEEQMNNPMSALMGLMSSGVMTDLMGQAQSQTKNGSLNVKKLLGSLTKMVEQISEDDDTNMDDINEKLKNIKV
jgi:hypothetical protein